MKEGMNTVEDIVLSYILMLLTAALGAALVRHFTMTHEWAALALAALPLTASYVFAHDGTVRMIERIKERRKTNEKDKQ